MKSRLICLFIFLLSSGLSQVWADDGYLFKRQNLKVDGDIIGKMYEDVNGDSLVDLLVFYLQGKDENAKRMVGFFKQQPGIGFDTIPLQIFELDKKASVLDLADLEKDGKKELLFLAEDGVYCYLLDGGLFNQKPTILFSTTCFLSSPEKSVLIWDFCPDQKNKNQMILIPQKKGYDVWALSGQKQFVFKNKLEVKPNISLSRSSEEWEQDKGSIHYSYTVPGLMLADHDKNGNVDVFLTEKDRISIFHSKGEGSFPEQADKVITLKSKVKDESPDYQIEDVNGDSIVDLILNESKQDLEKGSKTKISIHLGKEGEGFNTTSASQTISSEKEASSVWFYDLDKDGKKEMIMPSWGFSIGSMVKVLLTKSVKFNLYIRKLGEKDVYPTQPTREMKLSIKVAFGESDEENQAMDFSGDFNGDGQNDFFYVAGDNVMKFFLGRKGDFFADKSQYEMGIEIPTSNHKIMDLNNDDKSDMIFSFEKSKKELKGKISVFFSKM